MNQEECSESRLEKGWDALTALCLKDNSHFFFTTVVILIVFKLTKLMALILDCHLETVLTCDAMQKMNRMKGIRIFKPICQLLRDLH